MPEVIGNLDQGLAGRECAFLQARGTTVNCAVKFELNFAVNFLAGRSPCLT
jgi:hypothetical protein